MTERVIGVIGGSGLYALAGLTGVRRVRVTTPFGAPSDRYVVGRFEGARLVFLPRHGVGHRLAPSEVNMRANIFGFKKLGAEWIISLSAVGSMREKIRPGHVVVIDQFIDRTRHRPATFFGGGIVAHVAMADPICPHLAGILYGAAKRAGARVHRGGTYLCIEGPQFSTRAESLLYRTLGVDVIGMTNMPEAKLAREAEICYATLALATDYDCWHATEAAVSVDAVVATVQANAATAQQILAAAVPRMTGERPCPCPSALKDAIITARPAISAAAARRLRLLVGKYL